MCFTFSCDSVTSKSKAEQMFYLTWHCFDQIFNMNLDVNGFENAQSKLPWQWSKGSISIQCFRIFQEVHYPSGPHQHMAKMGQAHLLLQHRFPYLSSDPPWSIILCYQGIVKLVTETMTMRPAYKWPILNLILPVQIKNTRSALRKIFADPIPKRWRWLSPWFCPFGPLSSLA